mgnify:CR=1 FL=1
MDNMSFSVGQKEIDSGAVWLRAIIGSVVQDPREAERGPSRSVGTLSSQAVAATLGLGPGLPLGLTGATGSGGRVSGARTSTRVLGAAPTRASRPRL